MISSKITAKDICDVTGYNRDELRGLLKELPGYNEPIESRGSARVFTRQDMLILAICCEIETVMGINRKVLKSLVVPMRTALMVPRNIATGGVRLLLTFDPPGVEYLDNKDRRRVADVAGIVLPLRAIFDRVDAHLNPLDGRNSQRTLGVPSVVSHTVKTLT